MKRFSQTKKDFHKKKRFSQIKRIEKEIITVKKIFIKRKDSHG